MKGQYVPVVSLIYLLKYRHYVVVETRDKHLDILHI